MMIGSTGCCGMREITSLSSHKSAKEAIEAFCKIHWGVVKDSWGAYNPTIYTFYIFTAAVYSKADREKFSKCHPSYSHLYELYGHNFARFIRKNKLGKVWTSAAHINEAFHPDHQVKVWTWAPDKKALKAWWDANLPAPAPKLEVKKKVAPVQQAVQVPNVQAAQVAIDIEAQGFVQPNYRMNYDYLAGQFNPVPAGVLNDVGGNNNCGVAANVGQAGPGKVDR